MSILTRKTIAFSALFFALCALGVLFWAYVVEPSRLTLTRLEIPVTSWAGTQNRVRIVALADFHLTSGVREEKRLARIVERTLALNPDLVVLLGDYVKGTRRGAMMDAETIAAGLRPLAENSPVLGCLGNHDGFYGNDEIIRAFKRVGVDVERKAVKTIFLPKKNLRLQMVIALDSDSFGATEDVFPKFSSAKDCPTILLAHSPDVSVLLNAGRTGGFDFDFVFCGHTHGGQICLPGGFPIVSSTRLVGLDFAHGLKVLSSGEKMFVSRGLGTSILPLRLFCPPEIVVADFVSEK